jgi:hypothetical protein
MWNLGLTAIIIALSRMFGRRLLIWASRLA